ncbi:hypothetical protein FRB99_001252 [Tulasnella sp. 403]|nr:hypothetical protein FRB99_001252 [Tulasnella sp. 403]
MSEAPALLTPQVRLGLKFIVLVAFLSFLAVSSLLLYIYYKSLRTPPQGVEPWKFIRSYGDYYFLSLLFSNLIMAMGSIMNIAWVITANDTVPRGAYCTARGAMKQIGSVGTALVIFVIIFYPITAFDVGWRPRGGLRLPFAVIAIIWLVVLLTSAIPGSVLDHYYGPSLYWCWIEAQWYGQRLGLAYALYWLVAAVVIYLYSPFFLGFCSGLRPLRDKNNERKGGPIATWKWVMFGNPKQPGQVSLQGRLARMMVVYPIAYLVLVTPITVIRWVDFSGKSVPYQARFFADAMFASSGLVDVTLYLVTRGISANRGTTEGDTQHSGLGERPALGRRIEDRRMEERRRDEVVNTGTLADSSAAPSSSGGPWPRTRRDSGGRPYGLGMVTEGNLNDEPSDGTMSEGPLRRTRRDHVASQATFTTDAENISGGLMSPAAFLSPGGSRTHSSSSPPPDDRV